MSPRLRTALLAAISFFPASLPAGETVSRPGLLHLALDDAIRMTLAKNFSIEVSHFEPKIAREGVTKAISAFDPNFTVKWLNREDTRRDLFIGPRRTDDRLFVQNRNLEAGFIGTTPWGMDYDAGLSTFWNGETYETSAGLTLAQPLLRGAGFAVNLKDIRIARNNVLVSEWELRQQAIDLVTETIRVYNELHYAIENLKVAESSRALARQTLNDNRKRADIGVMVDLDTTTARAEVATREEGVIVALREVKDNENFLKQLVTNDLAPMLDIQIEIEPPPSPAFRADVPAGIAEGIASRPDYRKAVIDLENRHITLAFRKNQTLPTLDLQGSLELLGFDNDIGGSVKNFSKLDRSAWTIGAIFSVPIPNRGARSDENAARLSAAQGIINLHRIEQQIVVDIDNASGKIVSSRQRIASTAEASKLARESLDAGEQRLRAGTGTTFEVLELQKRRVEAETAQLRARADYNEAVNTYYNKTGVTLRMYRVSVEK